MIMLTPNFLVSFTSLIMLNFEKNLEMNLLLQGEKGQDGLSRLQQLMSLQTFVVHDMLTSSVATAHYLLV